MKKKKESARERAYIQHHSSAPLGPLDPVIAKSHLQLHAPPCPNCRKPMRVRILIPGRIFNEVDYRCEECGAKELRSVPRPG
jgi:hypothetical protein